MSYPAQIQVLVVEDEPAGKAIYEQLLGNARAKYALAPTCYAFSYDDATEYLNRDKIFHLVLLDLRLPKAHGVPAGNGVDYGVRLSQDAAQRDAYPIPALVVVSGHIDSADQTQLQESLQRGFYHGQVIVKNYDRLQSVIDDALQACTRYVGIGIHLREPSDGLFPGLSPREEDLLRRFALREPSRVGLDLAWWSTEKKTSREGKPLWTKVLVGRALLDGSDTSRIMFFKLVPNEIGASYDIDAATRLAEKLSHVKVKAAIRAPSVSLIVTEKVGSSDQHPVAMIDFLRDSTDRKKQHCEAIAKQIVQQIGALGERGPDVWQVSRFLWQHHDVERIRRALLVYGDTEASSRQSYDSILNLLTQLMADTSALRFKKQTFLHGDLHVDNVALDCDEDDVQAFIFDAGATEPHASVRDIANLEVSLLVHHTETLGPSIVELCRPLYECSGLVPEAEMIEGPDLARNLYALIRSLRVAIQDRVEKRLYSLLVFDASVIQLGGLDFGSSNNKIARPAEAVLLAQLASEWYKR